MAKARIDNFTSEQLAQLVAESDSFNDLIPKLGYNTRSGSNHNTVKSRLDKYGIETTEDEADSICLGLAYMIEKEKNQSAF